VSFDKREGEVMAAADPAELPGDARLVFIGRIRSPWRQRSDCPKNLRQARERAPQGCQLEIDKVWRLGLTGLEAGQWINLLYWMHEARRDILIQHPRHRDAPTGVFSLRSPVRPNPVALALVQITSIDIEAGTVGIDATDALDGTPLVDVKPYLPSVDLPPE
jgi:tRNA-Thr(GGU) m(6)t(6)A37 methyltransferase TsaA